jgi:DNA repair exonuclease SbcCD ATPase subunit
MRYHKEIPKQGRILMSSGPRDQQKRIKLQTQPAAQPTTNQEEMLKLREEIVSLKERLAARPDAPVGTYTAEDLDQAVNDALPEINQLKEANETLQKTVQAKERQYEEIVKKLGERDQGISALQADLANEKQKNASKDKAHEELSKELTAANNAVVVAEAKIETLTEKIESLKEVIKTKDDVIETLKKAAPVIVYGDGPAVVEDPDRPKMDEVFIDPLESDAGSKLESHINVEDTKTSQKVNVADKVNKLKGLMGSLPPRK